MDQFKLSELYEISLIGRTEIPEYKGGNDRILDQEREFCVGDIDQRYADYKERGITKRESEQATRADKKLYKRLKPLLDRWVETIDRCEFVLKQYFPDYEAWGDYVYFDRIVIDLAGLGLVEWDIPLPIASTTQVINFIFSDDLCDTPNRLAERAFEAGAFDVLLATRQVLDTPLSPREYWRQKADRFYGTSELRWFEVCHYDVMRGIYVLDLLATLEIPSSVRSNLTSMGISLNPDGSEASGYYNNQNVFAKRYQTFIHIELVFGTRRTPVPPDDKYKLKDVLDHQDFIRWHRSTLKAIGEDQMRSIYGLFGIRWDVIEDVLTTLPDVWWCVLGVDPKNPPTPTVLRQIYRDLMKQAHPDVGGSHEYAQTVIEAFGEGLKHCKPSHEASSVLDAFDF